MESLNALPSKMAHDMIIVVCRESKHWYGKSNERTRVNPLTVPAAVAVFENCNVPEKLEFIKALMTPAHFRSWFRRRWYDMPECFASLSIAMASANKTTREPDVPETVPKVAELKALFQRCTESKQRMILGHLVTPELLTDWFRSLPFTQMAVIFELASSMALESRVIKARSLANELKHAAVSGPIQDLPTTQRWREN